MFQVFDNGKPADYSAFPKLTSARWKTSVFSSFEEATRYAWLWLGTEFGGSDDGMSGIDLTVNVPWDYSGYGDMIEVRKVG